MNVALIIILVIESFLLLSCMIILALHIIKFRKYEQKYNNIWNKFDNENLEKDIQELIQNMSETRRVSEEARISSESIEGKMLKSLQKVGFVKYDAYKEGKNGLSFSLAILNANDDGVLINSIYNRSNSTIYAKKVDNGMCEGNLSKEEEEALQIAKNSKSFM